MDSFTNHQTANEITVSHPADGPVCSTILSWDSRELAAMACTEGGYAVNLGKDHPEPNRVVWTGRSWNDATRIVRQYAEMAAMMIAEDRPGWA